MLTLKSVKIVKTNIIMKTKKEIIFDNLERLIMMQSIRYSGTDECAKEIFDRFIEPLLKLNENYLEQIRKLKNNKKNKKKLYK